MSTSSIIRAIAATDAISLQLSMPNCTAFLVRGSLMKRLNLLVLVTKLFMVCSFDWLKTLATPTVFAVSNKRDKVPEPETGIKVPDSKSGKGVGKYSK